MGNWWYFCNRPTPGAAATNLERLCFWAVWAVALCGFSFINFTKILRYTQQLVNQWWKRGDALLKDNPANTQNNTAGNTGNNALIIAITENRMPIAKWKIRTPSTPFLIPQKFLFLFPALLVLLFLYHIQNQPVSLPPKNGSHFLFQLNKLHIVKLIPFFGSGFRFIFGLPPFCRQQ